MTTQPHAISRRRFLGAAGATTGLAMGIPALIKTPASAASSLAYPFNIGIASGDPLSDGVVLWTRLAPEPLAEDGFGGMPDEDVEVEWELASDEQFSQVVQSGTQTATSAWAHSVHVEVADLQPAYEYYYRFRVGTEVSPVGRTKTAPEATADVNAMNFAIASCQNFADGYYPAHRDIAAHDFDFVLFLGDYIYEGEGQGEIGRGQLPERELMTLADYRIRHGQYKRTPTCRRHIPRSRGL